MELNEEQTAEGHRRRQRRVLWAAAMVFLLLLLALTPPLLNVGRLQRRILTSMSESLGRPVHLDSVQLHLLPMPGFTLTNLVVSEDPTFGDEPTIRANIVEARLRISSLWKRRVEFSRVKFVSPSVNLVRNGNGRWNIEGVLLHASHIDTAPTAQAKAGAEPRFPYIEATGGRINIKAGPEKKPFALTDTDFALWLPSPQVWRLRLEGKPTRTDSNIGDPGVMRLEGSLQRAAKMADVPVDLQASWYEAPLGEASRLLTGDDRGWRGTLHADASLQGPLGAATLRTKLTLDSLRRADFVPEQPLDVSISCTSTADVPAATLQSIACAMPTSGAEPLRLAAETLDLSRPAHTRATFEAQQLPLPWLFGWARLLSQRIQSSAVPGRLDAMITHTPDSGGEEWTGTLGVSITSKQIGAERPSRGAVLSAAEAPATPQDFTAQLTTGGAAWELTLPETTVHLGPGAELAITAKASPSGYSFTANGQATPAQLAGIAHALPQLADNTGLTASQPAADAETIRPVSLSCSRSWSGGQSCAAAQPVARPTKRPPAKRHKPN